MLQNRTHARLNGLLASCTDTTTNISTTIATTTQPMTPQNLESTVSAPSSAQNRSVDPSLMERLQASLKPCREPKGFEEAVTHVLDWLWGVSTLLGLEGKSEEANAVGKMLDEIEQKFVIVG